jgi:hypothetical protein
VRTNWKSKNFNPDDDPTILNSSTDESDPDVKKEHDDVMSNNSSFRGGNKSINRNDNGSN